MFISLVSSPSKDSLKLKIRSASHRESECSDCGRPSSSKYEGSCPSFCSASEISSRSVFSFFSFFTFLRGLRTAAAASSFAAAATGSSFHKSYNSAILSFAPIIVSPRKTISPVESRAPSPGHVAAGRARTPVAPFLLRLNKFSFRHISHHQRGGIGRDFREMLRAARFIGAQVKLTGAFFDGVNQSLDQRTLCPGPLRNFVDHRFAMLMQKLVRRHCRLSPLGYGKDVAQIRIRRKLGDRNFFPRILMIELGHGSFHVIHRDVGLCAPPRRIVLPHVPRQPVQVAQLLHRTPAAIALAPVRARRK